ncbi:response regulator [Halobacteriales archaeon QH_10_67_22]|nr:MAG: response regulator [Halobacteriales archaeon QH_10_67_22]
MMDSSADPSVLVVDDEADVADVYALRLRDNYDIETAYGGQEALDRVADDVDVVLLDRRMPGVSGDEVLNEIRDRGLDCRVIMITAVDPDFDIVEMPFDDYLNKPVEKRDLVTAIEQQLIARRYDERLTEYLEVTSKLGLLEAEKTERELAENEDVERLRERAEELETVLDDILDDFEDAKTAFIEVERE